MRSMEPGGGLDFHQELAADEFILSAHLVSAQELLEVVLVQPDLSRLLLVPLKLPGSSCKAS